MTQGGNSVDVSSDKSAKGVDPVCVDGFAFGLWACRACGVWMWVRMLALYCKRYISTGYGLWWMWVA